MKFKQTEAKEKTKTPPFDSVNAPDELVQLVYAAANNAWKLPMFDEESWAALHVRYDKFQVRKAITIYIDAEKPPYPLSDMSSSEVQEKFIQLLKEPYDQWLLPKAAVKGVIEKFTDYKYSWANSGIGIVDASSHFNVISDYFMQFNRMGCGCWSMKAPREYWETPGQSWKFLAPAWRLGQKRLDAGVYVNCFRLGFYIATQFKLPVAKTMYEMTKAKNIIDTSAGWGDRMAAFYASRGTEVYHGCDPNDTNFPVYLKMAQAYEQILGCDNPEIEQGPDYFVIRGKKTVRIDRKPSEDMDWTVMGLHGKYDTMFTSPPYFATELYNKTGEHWEDQSWARYKTYEDWRDGFYYTTVDKVFAALRPGGYMIVNIMDPVVKGKRYPAGADLVDHVGIEHFGGLIGMRIMQRPQSLTFFEDGRKGLQEFMSKIYFEPVYVFRKPGCGPTEDFFRNNTTLEGLFE